MEKNWTDGKQDTATLGHKDLHLCISAPPGTAGPPYCLRVLGVLSWANIQAQSPPLCVMDKTLTSKTSWSLRALCQLIHWRHAVIEAIQTQWWMWAQMMAEKGKVALQKAGERKRSSGREEWRGGGWSEDENWFIVAMMRGSVPGDSIMKQEPPLAQ